MNSSLFPGGMLPNQTLVGTSTTTDTAALEKVAAEKTGYANFSFGTMSRSNEGQVIIPIFATAKDDVLV